MRKVLLGMCGVVAAVCLGAGGWVLWHARDRNPGYALDLTIPAPNPAHPLQAGFAAVTITPDVPDTWTDADGDFVYRPADGDTYADGNGNGRFDPVWMAGYHAGRAATGVHDDLWARAMVLDDGNTRLALVVLDAIGFMHDDVIDVRRRIAERAQVGYTIVCSTHSHGTPDLLGLWGKTHASGGLDTAYREFVRAQTADAVVQAANALRPARLRFAQDLDTARAWVDDVRLPNVLDPGVRLVHAVDAETGDTLGVLFAWGNHPETLGRFNTQLTSDFPHYLRNNLERGVYNGEELVSPGLGGVAVYVNGAIGGLQTTSDELAIPDPFSDTVYQEPSFEKARAQGDQLALLGLRLLRGDGVTELAEGGIGVRAHTTTFPMTNRLWQLALGLGVFDRGYTGWGHLRTEVALVHLGPASFLAVPGEIYPELVNGGIEAPPGRDFMVEPQELPPLRDLMRGEYRFILGLANDEVGYLIPRSEWDEVAPYLYDAEASPYGEITSPGAEAGPALYATLRDLLTETQ